MVWISQGLRELVLLLFCSGFDLYYVFTGFWNYLRKVALKLRMFWMWILAQLILLTFMLCWPESDMKDIRWYRYWIGYLLYSAHTACSPRIMIIIGQNIPSNCYSACSPIREIITDQPETSYCFLSFINKKRFFRFPRTNFLHKYKICKALCIGKCWRNIQTRLLLNQSSISFVDLSFARSYKISYFRILK